MNHAVIRCADSADSVSTIRCVVNTKETFRFPRVQYG